MTVAVPGSFRLPFVLTALLFPLSRNACALLQANECSGQDDVHNRFSPLAMKTGRDNVHKRNKALSLLGQF